MELEIGFITLAALLVWLACGCKVYCERSIRRRLTALLSFLILQCRPHWPTLVIKKGRAVSPAFLVRRRAA